MACAQFKGEQVEKDINRALQNECFKHTGIVPATQAAMDWDSNRCNKTEEWEELQERMLITQARAAYRVRVDDRHLVAVTLTAQQNA